MLFLARRARWLSWKETAEVSYFPGKGFRRRRAYGQLGPGTPVTRLLWVGKASTVESFQRFFTAVGQEVISKIAFIYSDLWESYLKVIREKCSEALHILDRFQIVAKMDKALDEVRAEETRRMQREGSDPLLKKSRWPLLKRSENFGDEQRSRPRDLLR